MPGRTLIAPSMLAEDSFLEHLAETLEKPDRPALGQFLRRFFRTIVHLDLTEAECVGLWDQILERRRELGNGSARPVSLRRAIMYVLAASGHLRVPVLIEYDDLKKLQINTATDSLTGLYNRRFFEDQCDEELNRALRYNQHRAAMRCRAWPRPPCEGLCEPPITRSASAATSSQLLLVQADAEQALTLARRVCANFAAATGPMEMAIRTGIDYGVAFYPMTATRRKC
jgi:GGDEF domain-containing protein